jgi:hypothetical protein
MANTKERTPMQIRPYPLVLAALALACASAEFEPITDCEPRGNARPICGFQNPEDLVLLPDGKTLVVSEYGAIEGGKAGRLALFDIRAEQRSVLFEGGAATSTGEGWGDPECPGAPSADFSPHGIHLSTRRDGRLQLLAVQHGGRESVEFFELVQAPGWQARWRGCAVPPEGSWLNDVVALPEGGFLVTHMLPKGNLEAISGAYQGPPPALGHVLEWKPETGFRVVPGTQSALPNGIELSRDGRVIYLNVSGANEVWRIDRASGRILTRAEVPATDNATFAAEGRLLVSSLLVTPDQFPVCMQLEGRPCPLAFQIVALHPESLEMEVLYRGEGAPMGGGTVGLRIADELFIGSFAGDRILRVRLD